jgi:hypothetical protein
MASSFGDVDVRLNTTCHGLSFFAELSEHYRGRIVEEAFIVSG